MKFSSESQVIILGAGRVGSTFLWQLLNEYGMDCGDHPEHFRHYKGQHDVVPIPEVVKVGAGWCQCLGERIIEYEMNIRHAILCVRNFEDILNSQTKFKYEHGEYRGLSEDELREKLKHQIPEVIGKALLNLHELEIPHTIIKFPDSAKDPFYCHTKLEEVFGLLDLDKFLADWAEAVKPEKANRGERRAKEFE